MQYITVDEKEAVDQEKGTLKDGYQKWAYVYKRVIPDTPEEIAAREAQAAMIPKAKADLKAMIAVQDADKSKITLLDVLDRLTLIETIIGVRKQ